jgi:hypothetical protein
LLGMSETGKEQKKSKHRQSSSELYYSSELYSGELSQIQPP